MRKTAKRAEKLGRKVRRLNPNDPGTWDKGLKLKSKIKKIQAKCGEKTGHKPSKSGATCKRCYADLFA